MGCSAVNYKSGSAKEAQIALRPYPDDINGINDKVANGFNLFLKTHGANPKPVYKDRPKLNFDIKDSKLQKRRSLETRKSSQVEMLETFNLGKGTNSELFINSFAEAAFELFPQKMERKSFALALPDDSDNDGPDDTQRKSRFSININAEAEFDELNAIENQADDIVSKYL